MIVPMYELLKVKEERVESLQYRNMERVAFILGAIIKAVLAARCSVSLEKNQRRVSMVQ